MPESAYEDRAEAGRVLAEALDVYEGREDVIVLALPRGGVPVACEIAVRLGLALDLLLVRKLGVPGHEELAFGAVASGGAEYINKSVVRQARLSEDEMEEIRTREFAELRRRREAYRGDRKDPEVSGRTAILVDDGLATGSTMLAGVRALRNRGPREIVVAVPVAPPDSVDTLAQEVDRVICPMTPARFGGVGAWYRDFRQTSDEEVSALLEQMRDAADDE